jgi:hypothetical protein
VNSYTPRRHDVRLTVSTKEINLNIQNASRVAQLLLVIGLATASVSAVAAETPAKSAEEHSPWLLAPVFSSDPKLGTSLGAITGYLHYFDEKSRPSIFAVTGQYTSAAKI